MCNDALPNAAPFRLHSPNTGHSSTCNSCVHELCCLCSGNFLNCERCEVIILSWNCGTALSLSALQSSHYPDRAKIGILWGVEEVIGHCFQAAVVGLGGSAQTSATGAMAAMGTDRSDRSDRSDRLPGRLPECLENVFCVGDHWTYEAGRVTTSFIARCSSIALGFDVARPGGTCPALGGDHLQI